MLKDSKIYIAGQTGLLGSALLRRLRDDGYGNIITAAHGELDLTAQRETDEFFRRRRPEYVFLCAALTGGIVANKTYPADFLHINLAIQDNVFQSALKYGVRNLVFYGSSCAYPKLSPQPIKEEYLFTGPLEETSIAYATAKIAGMVACRSYNAQYKSNRFICLVPATMYGPNDNFDPESSHVLAALIRKFHEAKKNKDKVVLWGSGAPRREFIYSDDVAEASLFAMKNADRLENTHYNVGTGSDYSIRELAELIAREVGFKGGIEWDGSKPDGTPRKLLDGTRFMALGWRPSVTFCEGVKLTYESYLKR